MRDRKPMFYLACYLLLRKGSKILLLRRKGTGYEDGNYTFVSGHLDGHETAAEAMRREAKEEAGIDIAVKDLRAVHVMHTWRPDREYVHFYFTTERWRGEPHNAEPDKADDLDWFEEDKLPKNIVAYIPLILKKIERGEFFTEYGFDRKAVR